MMMMNEEKIPEREETPKKTIYKETEERINEKEPDNGETSSVSDLGRTDLISTPGRKHKPLGSSHEPGTTPGTDI